METKDIEKIVTDNFKELEGKVDEKFQKSFDEKKATIIEEIEKKGFQSKEDVDAAVKVKFDEVEAALVKLRKEGIQSKQNKGVSFETALGTALEEGKSSLIDLKNKKSRETSLQLKAEDLNFGAFANDSYANITTDRTRGMYEYPFQPLWLRNVLPNSTTTEKSIYYLQENEAAGTGEVGPWDGSGDISALTAKPGVNFGFTDVTQNVEWLAGITRVKREMLDDVAWLQSYITRQLTVGKRGLFVAENTMISDALTDNSTAYDGTKTVPVEMVIDAAFGQLRDNYYFNPTILMNHRDVVTFIALNKATGSGEYDLPTGTVTVVGGQLILGGVPVIGVPNIDAGTFIVFDRNATEFVTRMSPEIRLFEQDRDNVIKNLITVRAEERATALVYDTSAVITGTFAEPEPEV